MRRSIAIALVVFGLLIMLTGLWQFFPPFNTGVEPLHVIPAFCFAILLIIHIWLVRKPLLLHFKGLGWKWALVGLAAVVVLWMTIGIPIMIRAAG